MAGVHNTHAALAGQPWSQLERPRAARLLERWQVLPELLLAKPFGELSGRLPGAAEAAPAVVFGKYLLRGNSTDKAGRMSRLSELDMLVDAAGNPQSMRAVADNEPGNGSESLVALAADGVEAKEIGDRQQQRRPLDLASLSAHANENSEPHAQAHSEPWNPTTVVYNLASRRVVGADKQGAERQMASTLPTRDVESPEQHPTLRGAARAPRDNAANGSAARPNTAQFSLAAITSALGARGAPTNAAKQLPNAGVAALRPDTRPETRRPNTGEPAPTTTADEPAQLDLTEPDNDSRARLGEQLMELLDDALVGEARRHGVDV